MKNPFQPLNYSLVKMQKNCLWVFSIRIKKSLLLFYLLFTTLFNQQTVNAQTELRYENAVYHPQIASVELLVNGKIANLPVIDLQQQGIFTLEFDWLGDEQPTLSYKLLHCNARWQPDDLMPFDFMDGFSTGDIEDYRPSRGTKQPYTHYLLPLPNRDMRRFLKSGNYLLAVYLPNKKDDNILLSHRLVVADLQVGIEAQALTPGRLTLQGTHQQLDFALDFGTNNKFFLPQQEITVYVLQNGRWDNALVNPQPAFMYDHRWVYGQGQPFYFSGGSDFRYFDTQSLLHWNDEIANILYYDDPEQATQVILQPDESKTSMRGRVRANIGDLNGAFVIGNADGLLVRNAPDYVWVQFFLPAINPWPNAQLYLLGAFTNWQLLPQFSLDYDAQKRQYTKNIYLKQGYYNYLYVLNSENTTIDLAAFEENRYNTENDYYFLVYWTPFGSQYDQLIGFKRLNTLY